MKHYRFLSSLVIVLISSCSSIAIPIPTATSTLSPTITSSPTFTPEPTLTPTPDPKEALSHYGLIAYTSTIDGNEDIFTMHADGSNQTNITNNPARDILPAWSPDGTRIAFISTRINDKPHVFTMNPDGSDVTQLADGTGFGFFFEWSPDGKKIAYVTYSDDPNIDTAELIVIDADGKNKTILTNKLFSEYEVLGWSPDSQYLVYTIPDGYEGTGLYIASADGTNHLEWSDLSYMDNIHWLDDKGFIVYSRFAWRQGQSLLQILSTDGSRTKFPVSETIIAAAFDKTYITQSQDGLSWFTFNNIPISSFPFYKKCEDSIWDTYFSFAPDKKSAFVTAFCSNTTSFFLVNDDGSVVQQIGDIQYDFVETTKVGWSPDGKYVARVISYLTPNYRTEEDIYIFDIQRILIDPSLQPMQLTTDGAIKSWGPIWQPIP